MAKHVADDHKPIAHSVTNLLNWLRAPRFIAGRHAAAEPDSVMNLRGFGGQHIAVAIFTLLSSQSRQTARSVLLLNARIEVCDMVAGGVEVRECGTRDPIAVGGVLLPLVEPTSWLSALNYSLDLSRHSRPPARLDATTIVSIATASSAGTSAGQRRPQRYLTSRPGVQRLRGAPTRKHRTPSRRCPHASRTVVNTPEATARASARCNPPGERLVA